MSAPRRLDGAPHLAYLIAGEDAGLVSQELSALVAELDPDHANVVEEYRHQQRDEPLVLGAVLDACRTPPFLSPRRLIVLRDGAAIDAAQQKELVGYLAAPLETTVLIIVVSGKTAPAALRKAVAAIGAVIDAQPQANARSRQAWYAEHLAHAPVHLDGPAAAQLRGHLGEDLSRLEPILAALASAYGAGATVREDDLTPFLGSAGALAPWDLTDAIDAGDIPASLAALARLTGAGERHPLAVLASLHRHVAAMLRLDGAEPMSEADAAVATKMSPYPAGKALRQARRLGHDRIARAVELLAGADLDLRGRIGWPPELVMEVLVARLAQLAKVPSGRGGDRSRHRAGATR